MKTNEIKALPVNNLIADDALLEATWSPSQVQFGVSVPTVENLKNRIQKILVALLKETWLPISLRGHMAKKVADLEEILNCKNFINSSMLMNEEPSISFLLSMYENTHPNSELIAQMRMLDQELNPSEYSRIASDERCAASH
ncbi:MAG: hypothetical protein P8R37_02950 [Opitutae bacterium]|nr:hypothetical protein [Opitutae bacterium]MDG1300526.1 hypothetical protein [Opitutae bacterium]